MSKQTEQASRISTTIPVDLIRVIAIVGVILLHTANSDFDSQRIGFGLLRWWMVDIYQCIGRMGVPLFIMLTGALLLAPSKKDEDMGVFFKKRFIRIGLPFIFWSVIYFLWAFYVENQPFTQDFIINGLLKGPHFILWYLYMLVGLYLITPLLRVMVSHLTSKHFKYIICLWAIGLSAVHMIAAISDGRYYLYDNLFLIPECVGYFIIGVYLVNVQIRRRLLVAFTVLGLALTAIGTGILCIYHGTSVFFFQNYYSPTLILASLPFFVLIISYAKSKGTVQIGKPSWKQRIMHIISVNTLPIYLLHIIIIYLLQNGFFFGFKLCDDTINSIVGIPLITVLTLGICLIIIVPLKKVPGLRHLIG